MPIKNYTTKVSATQTVGEIQGILASHGARRVMMDYGPDGSVTAVTFGLDCCGEMRGFRLEAKLEGIMSVMSKDRVKCDRKQAERIAWRNVKDWISAQVALVETELPWTSCSCQNWSTGMTGRSTKFTKPECLLCRKLVRHEANVATRHYLLHEPRVPVQRV